MGMSVWAHLGLRLHADMTKRGAFKDLVQIHPKKQETGVSRAARLVAEAVIGVIDVKSTKVEIIGKIVAEAVATRRADLEVDPLADAEREMTTMRIASILTDMARPRHAVR